MRPGMLVLCVLLAAPARAQNPAFSTIPACIPLVGTVELVTIDPAGEFVVVVADAGGPLAGCTVTVDFSGCCMIPTDIRIATSPIFPGCTYAAGPTISSLTSAAGVATFRIVGAATNDPGDAPAVDKGCAVITADCGGGPVVLGTSTVTTVDHNGVGGVDAADLAAWLGDFFYRSDYKARSDYDCDNDLGANDVSLWLSVKFGEGSNFSGTGLSCP